MLKIAVIFESSPFDRKGLFNAVHNRVKHLAATGACSVDIYCIHSRDTAFTRRVRHTPVVQNTDEVSIENLDYRILWYDFSITDHLILTRLHRRPPFFMKFMERTLPVLEGYDCICAHSFTGALFAYEAFRRYGTPYFVTWHGSDVHTHPWRNPLILSDTREVMENARCNFFVSKALLQSSERITSSAEKVVLYNGVSEKFVRYPDERRKELRLSYGLSAEDKVVAFVGSIVAVKNVTVLQPLFHEIQSRLHSPVKFWIIGDGKMRHTIEPALLDDKTIDVKFWGNLPAEDMPDIMNCIDVVVLPSLNEGLGMVCAEAVRCGASAVGSAAGGIPEVVGNEFVVPLGEDFVTEMADLIAGILTSRPEQKIPESLDWNRTAAIELDYLKSVAR